MPSSAQNDSGEEEVVNILEIDERVYLQSSLGLFMEQFTLQRSLVKFSGWVTDSIRMSADAEAMGGILAPFSYDRISPNILSSEIEEVEASIHHAFDNGVSIWVPVRDHRVFTDTICGTFIKHNMNGSSSGVSAELLTLDPSDINHFTDKSFTEAIIEGETYLLKHSTRSISDIGGYYDHTDVVTSFYVKYSRDPRLNKVDLNGYSIWTKKH